MGDYGILDLITDENDINIQKMYYNYLTRLIDATLLTRYQKQKRTLPFSSVHQVHTFISNSIEKNRSLVYISDYLMNIAEAKPDYYYNKLQELYPLYKQSKTDNPCVLSFYNEILNRQQNSYIQDGKKDIIDKLKIKLELTDKKRQSFENRVKFPIAIEKLKQGEINKEELNLEIAHTALKNKRNITKTYTLNTNDYEYLDELFFNGQLTQENIVDKLPMYNKKQRKAIINAYNKLLLPYFININIGNVSVLKEKLPFNCNNFKIYTHKQTKDNIKELLNMAKLNLKYDQGYLKEQAKELENILKLIPIVNLVSVFDIFDIDIFYDIIVNFSKIQNKILEEKGLKEKLTVNQILNFMPRIIELSEAYKCADNKSIAILGEKNITTILQDNFTSCNPHDYIKLYLEMLSRSESSIPPLNGEFNDYTYESGNYSIDRLLIGKYSYQSCIGIKSAGEEAYKLAVNSKDADVLLMRDKYNHQVVGRSLIFRRGNFLILGPIMGVRNINDILYNEDFLLHIGNEFLDKTIENNDNIQYVLITLPIVIERKCLSLPVIDNKKICKKLPHSDIYSRALIIASNKKKINLRPSKKIKKIYLKNREPIQLKETNYELDILRIETLARLQKNNPKDISISDIAPYDKVYVGQDWYIGMKDDKIVSSTMYKVEDIRQRQEIESIIRNEDINQYKGPVLQKK